VSPEHQAAVQREFAALGGRAPCRPRAAYLAATADAKADVMEATGHDATKMRERAREYRKQQDVQPAVRSWSAIKLHGRVLCEVIDTPLGSDLIPDEPGTRRPWKFQRTDLAPPIPGEEDYCPCQPGHPCPDCQTTAEQWWEKTHRQDTERWFVAISPSYHDTGWRASDYGERLAYLNLAVREARRRGWSEVLEVNGNGKKLALHAVPPRPPRPANEEPPGKGQLQMFATP